LITPAVEYLKQFHPASRSLNGRSYDRFGYSVATATRLSQSHARRSLSVARVIFEVNMNEDMTLALTMTMVAVTSTDGSGTVTCQAGKADARRRGTGGLNMNHGRKRLWAGVLLLSLLLLAAGCGGVETGSPPALPAQPAPAVATGAGSANASAPSEAAAGEAVYRRVSAEEAKQMMDGGNVIVLDVRTQQEFAEGHIQEAVLLTDSDIAARAGEVLPDKDATILVYCRSGRRSEMAANKLVEMGYTGIHDFGGIIDWPYEVV
jgi:rhodanese-related sulfurtransferase